MTDKSTIDLKALRQSLRDPKHKVAGRKFNRYDLVQEISRGGMGIVVRAKRQELGLVVALKLLASEDPTPEATARFRREAKVLAQLKHPHVVGVSDMGEDGGIHFLAMELIEGPDLHSIVKDLSAKGSYLEFRRVAEIALAMAKALEYCHEKGAIHRDVKPQNMLIEHKTDRPVLTDFGLVKRDRTKMQSGQSAAISQAGKILGTPSFMAPEQFEPDGQFGKVGPKSDVWGLGATLFFCLTGQPPYTATNVVNLYSAVMNDPPPRVGDVREGIPPALEAITAACLTKNVAERISMADLVKQLEELKNDPSQLEGPKGNAGLRHAAIVIGIFIALAILHLTVIDRARGKKIWRAITGGAEAPETPGGGTDTPAAVDKDVQRAADGEVDAMLRLAKKAILAKDYAEALRRYEQAGDADEVQGMFEAGRALANLGEWEGKLPKNVEGAKDWFKKAAKKGHEESMLEMAGLTLSHPMVAKAWYERVLSRPGESEAKKKASEGLAQLKKDHPDLKD